MTLKTLMQRMSGRQISIAPLVTFRIIFGIMMMAGTARFMALGWIDDHYVRPSFHFKYYGFEWVPVLPAEALYAVHVLLILSALFVTLGLFYRLAAIVQFVLFSYTELIDLTYYLNHYYFISLAALLLILVPANRYLALDVLRKPKTFSNSVPAWCINIFRLQLAIVYIYAGLAKINHDWLIEALPLRIWLPAGDKIPLLGPLFGWEYAPHLFSWFGMIYDTTIIFWLMWTPSRPWAYASVIVFHLLTGILFQIGVFPVIMVGATLIFFSDSFHQKLHLWLAKLLHRPQMVFLSRSEQVPWHPHPAAALATGVFLSAYFIFQLLFPWRFALYPGNMFWTEQGYRFGWRVMLMEKAGTATFYVRDSRTGREGQVFNHEFLNTHQEKQMAMQPDMILQFAHHLGRHYEQSGVYKPKVRAEVFVTFNGRPGKLLIDPNLDLMTVRDGWSHKNWITSEYTEKADHHRNFAPRSTNPGTHLKAQTD